MAIDIGSQPEPLTVRLSRGGSFFAILRSSDPWQVGIGIKLKFWSDIEDDDDPIEWIASITSHDAIWSIESEDVLELIIAEKSTVRLMYVEQDGSIIVWGAGEVIVV